MFGRVYHLLATAGLAGVPCDCDGVGVFLKLNVRETKQEESFGGPHCSGSPLACIGVPYFFTSGQPDCAKGRNASFAGTVSTIL